jgi:hypothetical protein
MRVSLPQGIAENCFLVKLGVGAAILNMALWYNGGGGIEEEEREWGSN